MISKEKIPKNMRALVLERIGDLRYENRPVPSINNDEVLLKIKNCGICSSDIERIFVNGTYHFPTVPGHEFCGEIVAVYDENDLDLLGKSACVFPLLPCKKCNACHNEEYAQCSDYNYFGSRCDGAYQEYLAVPKWNLVIFHDLDFKTAAMCEPCAVAMHALNRINVIDGKMLVIGAGTIGLLLSMIAHSRGIDVYVGTNKEKSKKIVDFLGLNALDMLDLENELEKYTNGDGFDYIFEATGSNNAIEQSILAGANFAQIVVIGNPKQDLQLSRNIYWKILRKQMNLIGTWNSSYGSVQNDWKASIEFMIQNEELIKKLITHTYRLDEYDKAFALLRNKEKSKVKVMFEVGK